MKLFVFMKLKSNPSIWVAGLAVGLAALSGCAHEHTMTSSYQPGPRVGTAAGVGVGAVVGNVAGGAVGFGEGVAGGTAASFDTTRRVVRRWRTETTSDGRTITVSEEVLVDADGRPVRVLSK
jgi:hypothetical protein